MLEVVASLLAVVCRQMQELPRPISKTLETMCNERAQSQQCWKSCANGSNFVAPHVGDQGTKELLRIVGPKVSLVSNFAQQLNSQQHVATCNRMCKWTQHITSNNFGSFWPTMSRPFARGFTLANVKCKMSHQGTLEPASTLILPIRSKRILTASSPFSVCQMEN